MKRCTQCKNPLWQKVTCTVCGTGLMHPVTKAYQCLRCGNIQPGQPVNQSN